MTTFIDLFCGIGGFRLGMEQAGFQCVFSAEINSHACQMYQANFGDNPFCDITQLEPHTLPNFDILCAGFPCQSFSKAGKQKGFDDTRGTLFFDICRIVDAKRPRLLLLENVKNLTQHDSGNTFKTILEKLDTLNYAVTYSILNAKDFGTPQNRERTIIVAVDKNYHLPFDFSWLTLQPNNELNTVLEKDYTGPYLHTEEYTLIPHGKKQPLSGLIFSGYRNKNLRIKGILPGTEHLSRCHKQPNRIYCSSGTHPTLSSQESSGRYFILIKQPAYQVRKLTMLECFRLMGFPDDFIKVGAPSLLYNRIGNSICVPMVAALSQAIKKYYFSNNP